MVNAIQYGFPTSCVAASKRRTPTYASASPSRPHRHLASPSGRPREQQVRDVGTGNQQDEADGAHQRQEDQLDRPAVHALVERHHASRHVFVGVGVVGGELPGDGFHLRLRLRIRDAVAETAEHFDGASVALLFGDSRQLAERDPEIRVVRELETLGHHADHGRRNLVDLDRAAEYGGIAAVAILPDAVAENHHRAGAGTIVVREEIAPDERLLADQLEGVGRDVRSDEAFGRPSFVADVHGLTAERRQAGEGARRPPPVFEVRERRTAVAVPRIA
jgi:hypothetical protein